MTSRLLIGLVCLAWAAGCDCGGPGTRSKVAIVAVEWVDGEGATHINNDATYDFGTALIGQHTDRTLIVHNQGEAKLTLSTLSVETGDDVSVPSQGAKPDAPFEVNLAKLTIDPGSSAEFPMTFAPKRVKGLYESRLKLDTEGTRNEDRFATITLEAHGEGSDCSLPEIIDFGNVTLGEQFIYPVELSNPATIAATAHVSDITGPDAASFTLTMDSARGDVTVPPRTSAFVKIAFTATEKRVYTASIELSGVGECPRKTIQLRATGSDEVLSWTPMSVDFGYVNPGDDGYQYVTFHNPAGAPVTLTQLTFSRPDFELAAPSGQPTTSFTVRGSGDTQMKLGCSPTGLGRRTGTFTFRTGLNRVPMGSIALTCTGGGPRIRVAPRPNVAFGRVGYFPGGMNASVSRRVAVQNVGSRALLADGGTDLKGNLYLGSVDTDGTPGVMPYIEVNPTMGLAMGELQVSLATAYAGATGLEAVVGRNNVDLSVVLTPASTGRKEAELIIHSNDHAEPAVRLLVSADVQQLPPCIYSITPTDLNFGLVTPGTSKELPITIKNNGTDACYFSGIDLRVGSDPAYSIVGGPIDEREVAGGASFTVVVRVSPQGPVPNQPQTLNGQVQLNVSSPTTPQARVNLTTLSGPSCLVASPDPLDFGTVKTGCHSRSRALNLYNACSTDIYLKTVGLPVAAGQPAGGPNCMGGMACPEFAIVQQPSIPTMGLRLSAGSAPVTVQVGYSPIDVGADTGAISLGVLQGGQDVTYLVGLKGNADNTGIATDTFVQAEHPKADVLFVIDDSGSMNDKQISLGQNFQSFIQFAQMQQVDFHLAVTTTSDYAINTCVPGLGCSRQSEANGGRMNHLPADGGLPEVGPVLTPRTPGLNQAFARLANVGPYGNDIEKGLKPAVLALTPPLITNENAGFLRDDASLAVIVVSDAYDQSEDTLGYYRDRLLNVKGLNRLSSFTFNNVGPLRGIAPSWCVYDLDGDPMRYNTLVRETGGVRTEICTMDWARGLELLGQTAFSGTSQFFLNNVPNTGSMMPISVKLDGMTLPASAWSYDSASNSINFTAATKPARGQTLTITYPIACL